MAKNEKKETLGKNSPDTFSLLVVGFRLGNDKHLIMCAGLSFIGLEHARATYRKISLKIRKNANFAH